MTTSSIHTYQVYAGPGDGRARRRVSDTRRKWHLGPAGQALGDAGRGGVDVRALPACAQCVTEPARAHLRGDRQSGASPRAYLGQQQDRLNSRYDRPMRESAQAGPAPKPPGGAAHRAAVLRASRRARRVLQRPHCSSAGARTTAASARSQRALQQAHSAATHVMRVPAAGRGRLRGQRRADGHPRVAA
ncbi:hypothetical protein ON010_g5392 [Phytophthora cinnamomi]|nr:hypothetical protein ON010_g5392 [Phytophthora cinnamomi]